MNRKPRTEAELYRWHRETLAHIETHGAADRNRPRMSENDPQPGWYMRRLVQKGPYVPCRIWVEPGGLDEAGNMISPEKWFCEVDGQKRDVAREWTWLCGHPISEDKFMDMLTGAFAQPRETKHMASVAPGQVVDVPGNHSTNIPEIIPKIIPEPLQTDDLPEPQSAPEQTGAVKTMF